MGLPPWFIGALGTDKGGSRYGARDGCLGLLDVTVGLNVTVLCGFGAIGRGPVEPWAMEEMSGVVSVELDAMLDTIGRYSASIKVFEDDQPLKHRPHVGKGSTSV